MPLWQAPADPDMALLKGLIGEEEARVKLSDSGKHAQVLPDFTGGG